MNAATALTRPPRLRPGARIAVVAPSGPVVEQRLWAGLDVLRGWGLDPVTTAQVTERDPEFRYLAGEDEKRARDFQDAWCDPRVEAVMCARGGYGAQRMIDLLDWDALRAAGPKVFIGYSDATVLHEAFAARLGLSTLYGPMAATLSFLTDTATQESLRTTLFEPEAALTLGLPGAGALVPGRARGVTFGGCLSLLAADLATPGARPPAEGGLLLLEDIGEQDYRLDRTLSPTPARGTPGGRHRHRAGLLAGVRTLRGARPSGAARTPGPPGRAHRRERRIRALRQRPDDAARRGGRPGRGPGHPYLGDTRTRVTEPGPNSRAGQEPCPPGVDARV